MTDIKIFTEIGIGNAHFISTEVEIGDRERRVRGCIRMKLKAVYIRVWIGKTVYAFSLNRGFTTKKKTRKAFKCLLGFEGIPARTKS